MENDAKRSHMINAAPLKNNLESIRNYAEHERVPARQGRKCVDGRYTPDQDSGMIARPGGDFGYVMALMTACQEIGLGLSPQDCFDRIYSLVTENDGTFYMHTDHHADPEDPQQLNDNAPLIGCGHISKALIPNLAELYGVDPIQVQDLVDYARQGQNDGKRIRIVNLGGDHQEKDVLVVRGRDATLNPHNEQEMHFLYDQDRDEDFMKELVVKLQSSGLAMTYEQFKAASDRQLTATLQLLAPGKSIYEVDLKQEKPAVSFVSVIEEPPIKQQ